MYNAAATTTIEPQENVYEPFEQIIEPIDDIACLVKGPNTAMKNTLRLVERVAANSVTVLLLGESGSGKEVLARLIHKLSSRKEKPFCALNCAAIPETLIESELFGYEHGAFTGANKLRRGKFEVAEGGTVFLDEIEASSPAFQQKILRVIEHKEIERIGGNKVFRADLRFIATSNTNLKEEVREKRFREDLLFRLTIPIYIPPLRDRIDDIPCLAYFILLSKIRAIDKEAPTRISTDAMHALQKAPWRGNVRELENVLTQAVLNRCSTDKILREIDITPFLEIVEQEKIVSFPHPQPNSLKDLSAHTVEEVEKTVIRKTLEETNWNRKEAARRLKISYRTLRNKIKKWQWQKS